MKLNRKKTTSAIFIALIGISLGVNAVSARTEPDTINSLIEKIYYKVQMIGSDITNLFLKVRDIETTTEDTNVLSTRIKEDITSIKSELNTLDPHILLTDRTVQEIQDTVELNQDYIESHHETAMTQFSTIDTHIQSNAEKLNTVITNQFGLDLQMDGYYDSVDTQLGQIYTKLNSIDDSITALDNSMGNVKMDSTTSGFHATTEGTRSEFTYDSIRHVSLSCIFSMNQGDHISLFASMGGQVYEIDTMFWNDQGRLNQYEFNTDHWYIHISSSNDAPDVNYLSTIVTFEEI